MRCAPAAKGSRKNKFTFWRERRAGRCRRRDAGDVVTSSRSGNAADAARRRAPKGCCLAKISNPMLDFRSIPGPRTLQQNVKLFLREP